ncbi:hypothetical protein EKI60_06460 [Candidatus Saccharibacteria bacterium]|nr:MAG: hypothetical protein EKI60_06460 [Candidatus Saccharibacteria bacterium]
MENQTTQTDNGTTQDAGATDAGLLNGGETGLENGVPLPAQPTGAWKTTIRADLRNSPLLQKFEDTPEGLNKALESHANLEKLLGHEKVPIPKDVNDVEGWNRFSKAMGIPDKAEGYGLPDANIPADMVKAGLAFDKNKFAEIMHAHKVHPSAVKGIWNAYQQLAIESYKGAMEKHQKTLTETVNALKGEWGDAYESNIELGQMVINKFSPDQETNDYITTVLSQNPRGIKFLAKIGDQFAENKVGEFQMKKFSLAPDEAMEEVRRMKSDMDGPYMNQKGKYSEKEHQLAVERVNALIASAQRARG